MSSTLSHADLRRHQSTGAARTLPEAGFNVRSCHARLPPKGPLENQMPSALALT